MVEMKGGFILHDKVLHAFNTDEHYRDQDPHHHIYRNMKLIRTILETPGAAMSLISIHSAYGYVFKVDIPENEEYMAYEFKPGCQGGLHDKECYQPVRSYVIKLAFIGPRHGQDEMFTRKAFNGRLQFEQECYTQYNAYNSKFLNGLYYIPPMLSPHPLFLNETVPIDPEYKSSILAIFSEYLDHNFTRAVRNLNDREDIGLILMGFADGYMTLHRALQATQDPNQQIHFRLLCKCVHILFCYDFMYYHGDHHMDNVLINPTYEMPFEWYGGIRQGRALLIDFGFSGPFPRIPIENRDIGVRYPAYRTSLEFVNTYLSNNQYTSVLQFIHEQGLLRNVHLPQYQWLRTPEPGVNQDLLLLTMMQHYMAFQDQTPYKNVSVERMMRNHIFVLPAALPVDAPSENIVLANAEPIPINQINGHVGGGRKKRKSYKKKCASKRSKKLLRRSRKKQ